MANTSYTVLREFTDDRYCRRFYPGEVWVGDPLLGTPPNNEVGDRTANGHIAALAAAPTPPASTVPYPRGA